MTYCVAMNLSEGMLFAADSRTNAGIDHVSTFCKMHVFEVPGKRVVVMLSAGNLATSQSVVSLLREEARNTEVANVFNAESMHHCARLVGIALRSVISQHQGAQQSAVSVDFRSNFLVGGQILGEEPRLFHVYPQGNFIGARQHNLTDPSVLLYNAGVKTKYLLPSLPYGFAARGVWLLIP